MAKDYKMTALAVTRNENVFTFSWKWGPDATITKKPKIEFKIVTNGQDIKKVKATAVTLAAGAKTYQITIDPANYYPQTADVINYIWFRVHYLDHPWVEYSYPLKAPNKPTLSASAAGVYSWDTLAYGYAPEWLADVEWQSVKANTSSYSAVSWTGAESGTAGAISSKSYTDTSGIRWFRVRSRGPAGASDWTYLNKVYNASVSATNIYGSWKGYRLGVDFTVNSSPDKPVTSAEVQYNISKPDATYQPTGSWATAGEVTGFSAGATKKYVVKENLPESSELAEDLALWVRIITKNAGNSTTSPVIYIGSGKLKAPTLNSITWNTQTKTVSATFTNTTTVPNVKTALIFNNNQPLAVAGVGATSVSATYELSDNIKTATFGIVSFVGSSLSSAKIKSETVWQNVTTDTPKAVTGLTASLTDKLGRVALSWDWTWTVATGAIISWADSPEAWESTAQPQTYEISEKVTNWLVDGLEMGKKWYFKVRLKKVADGSDSSNSDELAPWSDPVSVDLSSSPEAPAVSVSDNIIAPGEQLTVYWAYVTTDNTEQASATVYADGAEVATVTGAAQSYSFNPTWSSGTSHSITVVTTSASGRVSGTSAAVTVNVANLPVVTVSSSLSGGILDEMPLHIEAEGAGVGSRTDIIITRYGDSRIMRPDETVLDGFDGETIYNRSFNGEVTLDITVDDLVGRLDDDMYYLLTVVVSDNLGQTAVHQERFMVAWDHQAEKPTATVVMQDNVAFITPVAPVSADQGDFCRIYRLSKDKPELIMEAEYGTEYVDPYPASGGGYRVVDITTNGDYMAPDMPAWIDIDHNLQLPEVIIDYDEGKQIRLPYNITLANAWNKDFERNVYLNGAVQGDWNKAVTRDTSISSIALKTDDPLVEQMHDLAAYAGLCHVRTPEGSSYSANITVNESGSYGDVLISYDIKVERVDPEGYEAMTKADWDDRVE